ncbi:AI-2E family transporter [Simplicispira suum]|uniref:AI-2E family transporter n=1 Tax=Simplicispira suum TaxID=2109915 RepID=A0A2S0N324_9BURK|nr:AI-2E family transporter [Simplicispira suum]AVO42437.1 AI-2E family transporter [Simplicispira suum]MBW7831816.1 AI-2E family transporter [Simplicispira suum]
MTDPKLQDRTFLLILIAVSIAFLAILWPYYEAVFWGVALAILFAPLHRRLLARMPRRRNLAALCTLLLCLVLVILPVSLLSVALVQEATLLYERIKSGQLNFGAYFQQVIDAMPAWAMDWLDRMQLTSVSAVQEKLSAVSVQASQLIATRALNIGQNTLQFVVSLGVMLYLLFFLLRDGRTLAARIRNAVPLKESQKSNLSSKFTTVIRATLKGNLMVAACQGLLGGLIFWVLGVQGPILWGVLMAFLSLLPAIGAGLIWAPVAIYFFATGALWQAAVLTAFGVAVIGMVDNVLRPILVGRDTKMPDYVILISTLGGMTLLGLNGFVIGPVVAALFMACWDLFAPGDSL